MMLVIYGPTVTGKTDLAIKIAKKYNGELISADSRQVYKGLEIGSGKIPLNYYVEKHDNYWILDGVKVWGYDVAEINTIWTASDFIKFTDNHVKRLQKLNKLPIIVGGTGFYIKSFLYGIDTQGIPATYSLRTKLGNLTVNDLAQRLKNLNIKRYQQLNESDIKNPRRLIRSIEIAESGVKTTKIPRNLSATIFGLSAPNEHLFKKADSWLDTRLTLGLKKEIEELINLGAKKEWLLSLGLEYKWITKFINHELKEEEAILKLKSEIHNLIRRQKTFFNQFKEIKIYDITEKNYEKKLENSFNQCYTQLNG